MTKKGSPTTFKVLIDEAEGAFVIQFEEPYEWLVDKGRLAPSRARGCRHGNAVLSEVDIVAIRSVPGGPTAVARALGLNVTTVRRVLVGQTYAS